MTLPLRRALATAAVGLAIAAIVSLLVLGLPAILAPVDRPETGGAARVGAPFALIDAAGRPVTDRDFRGRRMLVLFGSLAGEGLARPALQVIVEALRQLGDTAAAVVPIFITLTPDLDTGEHLQRTLSAIDPRIVALTGTPETLAELARAYHVPTRPLPGSGEKIVPDPARLLYVMDESGQFQFHVPMPTAPDTLAERLAQHR
ncbi:MAG: SCO family protein [Pseudomonadota bacterium]